MTLQFNCENPLNIASTDYVDCVACTVSGSLQSEIDGLCFMGPSEKNEKSILLDGVDEYVDVNWTGVGGNNPRSVSFWFKTSVTSANNERIVYMGVGGNFDEKYYVEKVLTTNHLRFRIVGTSSTGNPVYEQDIADGQWHHVLWAYPGSGDTDDFRVWFDGVEVTSELNFGTAGTPNTLTTNNVLVGQGDSNNYFEGNIDEVAVWDVDISAAACEIYALGRFQPDYAQNFGRYVFASDLQLWLRCGDGDTHPTLTDASGNSRNGTMTNTESGDIVSDSAH